MIEITHNKEGVLYKGKNYCDIDVNLSPIDFRRELVIKLQNKIKFSHYLDLYGLFDQHVDYDPENITISEV